MRGRRPLLAAVAVAAALLAPACGGGGGPGIEAQDLVLRVTASGGEVEPGRAFPLTVVRVWSKDLVAAPWDDRTLAPLAVRLEATSRREDDRRVEETRVYRAYAMSLQDVVVPPPTAVARPRDGGPDRRVRAEGLRVRVRPVLDPRAPGAPESPGEPLAEPFPWALAAAGALAALLAAAVVLRGRLRRRPGTALAPAPPTPRPGDARAEALAALHALRGREAGDAAARAAVVAEAADAVRGYVAARFRVPARERTTEEVVAAARGVADLGEPGRARLAAFLPACDRVKFAAHAPDEAERRSLLDEAQAFVEAAAPPGSRGTP